MKNGSKARIHATPTSGPLRYLGGGFRVGIPARDLTADEANEHGRVDLLASGLYAAVEPGATDEPTDQAATPDEPTNDEEVR